MQVSLLLRSHWCARPPLVPFMCSVMFCLRSGSGARWRENKELVIGGRWAEESVEIDQDLGGERGGTRSMVDSQPAIIAENEWVGSKRFATVLAPLRETFNPCPKTLFVIDDEHERFLLHQKHRRSKICSSLKRVRIGLEIDKGVCHA